MGLFGHRKKGPSVLIAAKEEKTVQDIRRALQKTEYDLAGKAVCSAEELLSRWDRLRPDITLIDCALPAHKDGLAALCELNGRRSRDGKRPALIFMAVFRESEAQELVAAALRGGADQIIAETAGGGVPAENLLKALRAVEASA